MKGAVWVQPGKAEGTVGLTLGYGRTGKLRANFKYEGQAEDIPVGGYNAYAVRAQRGECGQNVSVESTGRRTRSPARRSTGRWKVGRSFARRH